MNSVIPNLPLPKAPWRANSSSSKESLVSHSVDNVRAGEAEQASELEIELDPPNLRDLNTSLQLLSEVFPEIQPEVLREMLSSFSEESRVQVVTENLLKNPSKWVRGRVRAYHESEPKHDAGKDGRATNSGLPPPSGTSHPDPAPLAREEQFRSPMYCGAVREVFYFEFKGLSRSTIRAILAENNYSYGASRPVLLALVSKSWRFSLTSFFFRRRIPTTDPTSHPAVYWRPNRKTGKNEPHLRYTPSAELNIELWAMLIEPWVESEKEAQKKGDRAVADQLNTAQAEDVEELYDCGCCFSTTTMEHMAACDDQGHFVCSTCVRAAVNEGLYGQAWGRNVNVGRGTLRCCAPNLSMSGDDCQGCIPLEHVEKALREDDNGDVTARKFSDRFAKESIQKSRLPVAQCPFCSYVEADQLGISFTLLLFLFFPFTRRWHALSYDCSPETLAELPKLRFKNRETFVVILLALVNLCYLIPGIFPILSFFAFITITSVLSVIATPPSLRTQFTSYLGSMPRQLSSSLHRPLRRKMAPRLLCRNPSCLRPSCLNCHASWPPNTAHVCFTSARDSLRLALESAATSAIKRTCPSCSLSFLKDSGCNKLVCPCGYVMCYVCRRQITTAEGYSHFCQHFRERPGDACRDGEDGGLCGKCDLYRVEGEEETIRRAVRRAEEEWWEQEGKKMARGREMEGLRRGLDMNIEGHEIRVGGVQSPGDPGTRLRKWWRKMSVDYVVEVFWDTFVV
ncbi:hypothetical protein P152DRAFT_457574 [Eremomyces bilateralis CBS 781.70]|uniref:RING-type domain-containing protein n=1 Tax=Eremomyces bilateralis CBS 781.70 TaxID=1392243 RepID=A0A6G1G5D2_9PEZI|nr:uncharacterized protein P152DRAFT_457574 [Eremomyces bilateralis CBS 781.70]KAF1813212.1 hypothetical protein P152DRAFT_457574 [Eremomyces bilateralis CBS 781.70]